MLFSKLVTSENVIVVLIMQNCVVVLIMQNCVNIFCVKIFLIL